MAKKLDQIIVIDVEATCWEGSIPLGQESEIIQIGICPIDIMSEKKLEKISILIKPERSEMSEFCKKLTGLTPEQLEKGVTFKKACEILKNKYLTKKRTWASWGDYDRRQFEKQCKSRDIKYPFGVSHINIKNLFALMKKLPNEVGLAKALEILDLSMEGMHHRADDDAWNIATILAKLLF
ncbi:MAG: exonuclease domain-containing protein [Candidatus Helarchaeota archaeon]